MPITRDLLTPGTRFIGLPDDTNGVCVVVECDASTFGSYEGPEWVYAVKEDCYKSPTQKSTLIFHIDEIGEILGRRIDPDKEEAIGVLTYIVGILERNNNETHATWLKSYVESLK